MDGHGIDGNLGASTDHITYLDGPRAQQVFRVERT